ncbi:hypothetical protein Tco_0974435 [Tanacetum coccineum]|uniref:Uncharacterized protein n=1 Tax=Tanacetum coccineum TaxID=301880 RepID=A0ABQ5EBU1_9ASTR
MGSSSTQSLLSFPKRAFMPSPKLLFSHYTRSLLWGCLTESKCREMFNFSHHVLNWSSQNCFSLSEMISPGNPKRHMILPHMNFITSLLVIVATEFDSTHFVK